MAEKVWKDIRGNQEDILSKEKFGGYKTELKDMIKARQSLALRHKSKEEGHILIDIRRDKRSYRNENAFHGPMDYAKTMKLRFRAGDLDLPERRKRYTNQRSRRGGRRTDRCALAAK